MTHTNKIISGIRYLRESKGYSQDYVASMLGISQSTYANIELGKAKVTMERLMQISEILEADIHRLIDDDYSGYPPSQLAAETREMYTSMITELKSEISFLRDLVKGSQ
jgi:transcriptional regulator with XRE-family HTH domain